MIDEQIKCDELDLRQVLQDTSGPDDETTVRHLENCRICQQRLDDLAADEADWTRAASALSSDPSQDIQMGNQPMAWTESMAKALLSTPSHPEMLGRVGRYDVERLIGVGGMGVVFKAHDTELNRPVAVKLLAPFLASSGSARTRFAREARAAAGVVDDHVVPIHNVESDEDHPFLVMKYIAGGSLQQRIDREGPLTVREILRIGMQTAKGLAAAHSQGLIHRDVKPSNILLDEGVDRALLTDFGLARASDDANLTCSGFHPGTPHYMSPEQVRGEPINTRSDLFSLGCVLYAMCVGHPPFRAETSYGVLRRITDDNARPIRELNADVPQWLERIVMKLLSKSAEQRFESAQQVAETLESCLAHVQDPTTVALPNSIATLSSHSAAVAGGSSDSGLKRLVGLGFAGFLAIAATVIFIEFGKGKIRIETNSQTEVPVVIRQGDKEVQHLTVSSEGVSVRLAAGKYIVDIADKEIEATIRGGKVTLARGDTWVAEISVQRNSHASDSHDQPKELDESTRENSQYLHWVDGDTVRLSGWFAKTLKLNNKTLASVNALLTETWHEYMQVEHEHTKYSRTSEGHFRSVIGDFSKEQQKLEDKFWNQLDAIVDGRARELLHALSLRRGDGQGDDPWPIQDSKRKRSFPSILGWHPDVTLKIVDIRKKGVFFHYDVNTSRFGNSGSGESLPPELRHYWDRLQEAPEIVATLAELSENAKLRSGGFGIQDEPTNGRKKDAADERVSVDYLPGDSANMLKIVADQDFSDGYVDIRRATNHGLIGQVVEAKLESDGKSKPNATIDLSELTEGYYSVLVSRKDSTYETRWFLVERDKSSKNADVRWQMIDNPAMRLLGYWQIAREMTAESTEEGRERRLVERGVVEVKESDGRFQALIRFAGEEKTDHYSCLLYPVGDHHVLQLTSGGLGESAICRFGDVGNSAKLDFNDRLLYSPPIDFGQDVDQWNLNRIDLAEFQQTLREFDTPRTSKQDVDLHLSEQGHGVKASAGERTAAVIQDVEFAFRYCPKGEFQMGSAPGTESAYGDRFEKQRRVQLTKGFWIHETEVTQKQFAAIMGRNPSFWNDDAKGSHPVENVTWKEANEFCRKLSSLDSKFEYRLPTEAEWEYACRAGSKDCRYGDILDIAWIFPNTDEGDGSTGHRPVATKKPNAWGIHDMFGNVAEWCADWYGPTETAGQVDPKGPLKGQSRCVRGDDCFICWTFLRDDGGCMSGTRSSCAPEDASRTIGFRIVRTKANNKEEIPAR